LQAWWMSTAFREITCACLKRLVWIRSRNYCGRILKQRAVLRTTADFSSANRAFRLRREANSYLLDGSYTLFPNLVYEGLILRVRSRPAFASLTRPGC
jgi:hypothetical protein